MKKICVVTGTRAEYGLLLPLLRGIQQDRNFVLQLLVTGAHLSPAFGLTYRQIENDGFLIDAKIDMLLSSDSAVGIAKSVGVGILGMAEAMARLQPDIVLLLGDRYEILAAAQAAMLLGVPIGHIHGGERTEGAFDESIRHAITKMSHLHFTATEEYRNRVIQMGEQPANVFNVGALGIESIRQLQLLSKANLEQELGFSFRKINFLITLHPETLLAEQENMRMVEALLQAMDEYPEAGLIFTGANADVCGQKINQRLQQYVRAQGKRACFQMSLGQLRYFSALRQSDLVIGNSSSGVIEAPFFKKPTINIGNRQKGRVRALSVLDCQRSAEDIKNAILQAMDQGFLRKINQEDISLFGDGRSTDKILAVLKTSIVSEKLLRKTFFDMPVLNDVLRAAENVGEVAL
ncbi:UDP-N-acetylglucosamine 2-epimerase [Anaeromusa acidaminophila]|uniref:UDP-N-acetylglucosamine 2-epimerase n=1 Tax=Anaeromusa acidaminophila TaxID=81464 RepID=UPI0003808D12|nr:UDP-N-acetylglucosamine 2-epimerase [Anaeromusa acidaminophila]